MNHSTTPPTFDRRRFLTRASATVGIAISSDSEGSSAAEPQPAGPTSTTARAGGNVAEVKAYAVKPPRDDRGGRQWLLIRATTDDGLVGWGECFGLPIPGTGVPLAEAIGKMALVGQSPFATEMLHQTVFKYGYDEHPDLVKMGVLSGLDMACWDIIGKATGRPVYELLGGLYNPKIRTYTYLYADGIDSHVVRSDPKLAAERARDYVEQGFTAVKLDPISNDVRTTDPRKPLQLTVQQLGAAERVVAAVREAIGERADILIGTHGQFTASGAIRFAKVVERFRPLWFEEPVPPANVDEMAEVARGTSIPICAGERLSTKYDFRQLLNAHAARILNLDMGRIGGFLEAKKVAGLAEAHYAQITPHVYAGPLVAAASMQLAACSPNLLIMECIEQFGGFHKELLSEPLPWRSGYLIPSVRPGLGVEINEEAVRKYSA